jgi:hypothetical protein
MDEALEKQGVPLIDAIAAHARNANPAAMRLCLDRLVPVGKHRAATIELPPVETPDYTTTALGEIHRALAASEISTDEGIRLVAFVDRTARVLAGKAVGEIGLADRLARCEEVLANCMMMLGMPVPAAGAAAEASPQPAAPAATVPAIANNNAKTMEPATAAGWPAAAPAESPPVAKTNEAAEALISASVEAALGPTNAPPRGGSRDSTKRRLMESASPLALTAALDAQTTPAPPPRIPLAAAA